MEMDNGNNVSDSQLSCCGKNFKNIHGLMIHRGKVCRKKCSDAVRRYSTRQKEIKGDVQLRCERGKQNKTSVGNSPEDNHSGATDTANTDADFEDCEAKLPKILWPNASEKTEYQRFEDSVMTKVQKKGNPKDRLKSLSKAIYETGKEMFGTKEGTMREMTEPKPKHRRSKQLEVIRNEKKNLRRRWRDAREEEKAGLKQLYEDVKKRHRRLKRNQRRAERRRERKRCYKKFVSDPYKFARALFVESRSGKLQCDKTELEDHIKQTYRDEHRRDELPPMPGLKKPSHPGVPFDLGNFKESEFNNFIKKARAKSAPGGDGVSYKVYKNCQKLKHLLFVLLSALWKKREIMNNWCRAEGIYLPKQENAEGIGQFRPISLLNIHGKIYFGILATRIVKFLQANGYVNESVQKAGLPGIPGCIEHAYSIWEAIQNAKSTEEDLSVVWLDLANAYGSVPHKLLLAALDHFWIPKEVQVILQKYYDSFLMRFTTESFTTDWARLEVGIAAGCSISVILFILVMEIILQATDTSEEITLVKNGKKAFMDDITVISRSSEAMTKILERLDQLISWLRMKFKAKKSRSLTLRKGKQIQTKFKIAGDKIPTIKEEPVKSLGRWYEGTLNDRGRGIMV